MADKKISQLPAATLPLAGTELLPIVQSGTTDNITVSNLAAGNVKSNATTGVLQVTGPAAASTRVMTTPDANFTVARTDAAQNFVGNNTFDTTTLTVDATNHRVGVGVAAPAKLMELSATPPVDGSAPVTLRISSLASGGAWTAGAEWGRLEFRSADTSSSEDPDVILGAFVDSASGGNNGLKIATNAGNSITNKVIIWPTGGFSLGSNPTTDPAAGNMRLDTGNLVIGTSGKGIDFSATANGSGTMTSELLADYEEGTWTPTVTASTGSYTTVVTPFAAYTKVGRLVTLNFVFQVTNKGTGTGAALITNLPYTPANAGYTSFTGTGQDFSTGVSSGAIIYSSAATIYLYSVAGGDPVVATDRINVSISYFV